MASKKDKTTATPKPKKRPRPRFKRKSSAHNLPVLHTEATTKLTPEMIEGICALVRQGSWIEVAAYCYGVSHATLCEWLRKGGQYVEADAARERGVLPRPYYKIYGDLVRQIHKATAESEILDLERLNKFAETHVEALKFKMTAKSQYRNSSSWAPTKKSKVEVEDVTPKQAPGVELDKLNLPLETRIQILEALKKAKEQDAKLLNSPTQPPENVLDVEYEVKVS